MPSHKKTKEQRTVADRLRLVRLYRENGKTSARKFAKLNNVPEAMFRGWLRDAEAGKLANANPSGPQGVRNRSSQFGKIEERLVKYILLRREKFVTDKLGLSWVILSREGSHKICT